MTRRLLRWLLSLAPGDFRDRYRREFLEVFDARREQGEGGVRFVCREVAGAVVLVLRLRVGRTGAGRDEVTTTTGGRSMLDTLSQDLRFALRTLRRNPGFTWTAVAVLALGIGATTAIFSAANAYFFRPLPFENADRLVSLYETNPEFGWTHAEAAPANVLDWREQVDAFDDVAVYSSFLSQATYVGEDGEPRLFSVSSVSGNFFDVLGVRPFLGRSFRWDESWSPDDRVVVLSYGLWTREFGADPSVVGRTIELGSTSMSVVGVMPEGFTFPTSQTQIWTPEGWDPAARDQVWFRRAHWLTPVARLKPGITVEEADAQLQVVVGRLSEEYPLTNRVMGAGLMPMRDFLVMDIKSPLLLLVGTVGLLLLLACANVANLLLVRASDRSREVALRHALGAARGRVARLMVTESVVLGVVGGAAGLAVGWMGVRALERFNPLGIDGATGLSLDGRVLLFVLLVSSGCGLLFGMAPAFRALRGGIHGAIKQGSRAAGGRSRLVNGLVAVEVGLALLLVIGAALMVRTFAQLRAVDPGFAVEGTLAVQFTIPASRYPSRDEVLGFYDRYLQALQARPGVESAGVVRQLPLNGRSWSSQFQAEGWPSDRVGFDIVHRAADEGYFETMGIPLVRGRMFGPQDGAGTPLVVLVNEAFADAHFPGEDPVGQRIAYDRAANESPADHNWYEIIGVVGDQHQVSPGEPPLPEVFEHRDQDWGRSQWVVLRTGGDPTAAVPAARDVLRELDPLIPLSAARPIAEVWRGSMARQELILTLLGAFGLTALLLATVGVYGVTAQAARTRTQEIGIRMALGAAGGTVVGMMVRQTLAVVALGLVGGLGLFLLVSRALSGFLYGVTATDPATVTSVVVLLGCVAALACWVPARKATAVDPVTSLRAE